MPKINTPGYEVTKDIAKTADTAIKVAMMARGVETTLKVLFANVSGGITQVSTTTGYLIYQQKQSWIIVIEGTVETASAIKLIGSGDGKIFGEKETQVTSKTAWKDKNSQARIDVENPNPGKRPVQVHYQDAKGNKYLYDPEKKVFVDASTKKIAPKAINDNLKNKEFIRKLNVALEKYLWESGLY